MTIQEFFTKYQLLHRKTDNGYQWLVIDKEAGDISKKYRFDLGHTTLSEFELFTGKNLRKELDSWFVEQLIQDFNIID